jgi:hypothetical protein
VRVIQPGKCAQLLRRCRPQPWRPVSLTFLARHWPGAPVVARFPGLGY